MAKAQVRGLEEAINSIFKRYNSNLQKAVEYAAKQAEFDINFEAISCLEQYYENYDPNWYDRTDNLRRAFVPYNKVKAGIYDISAKVGVVYDPFKLDGVYRSEASKKQFFNPVDSTWVLKNYLNGIHPRTNGWPLYSQDEGLIYNPLIDKGESPDEHMKKYIRDYKDTFDKNVLEWFVKRVIRR